MDLDVSYLRKSVKLDHSLTHSLAMIKCTLDVLDHVPHSKFLPTTVLMPLVSLWMIRLFSFILFFQNICLNLNMFWLIAIIFMSLLWNKYWVKTLLKHQAISTHSIDNIKSCLHDFPQVISRINPASAMPMGQIHCIMKVHCQLTWAHFLSLAWSKLRLCSANHRPGYWSNLPCDWPSTACACSEQETEKGPCCPAIHEVVRKNGLSWTAIESGSEWDGCWFYMTHI